MPPSAPKRIKSKPPGQLIALLHPPLPLCCSMAIAMQISRFSPATIVHSGVLSVSATRPSFIVRCGGSGAAHLKPDFDKKAFRHDLTRSDNYNRKGFGHKKETLELMNQEFNSDVIKTLRENNFEYTWGNVTVKLAEAYGFCWGVERAVQLAYEARKQFPEERIWLTNQIIHNPTVKKSLEEMEVQNIPIKDGKKQYEVVDKGDVVILPGFGASVDEMLTLSQKNVQIIDTTCPWVSKV